MLDVPSLERHRARQSSLATWNVLPPGGGSDPLCRGATELLGSLPEARYHGCKSSYRTAQSRSCTRRHSTHPQAAFILVTTRAPRASRRSAASQCPSTAGWYSMWKAPPLGRQSSSCTLCPSLDGFLWLLAALLSNSNRWGAAFRVACRTLCGGAKAPPTLLSEAEAPLPAPPKASSPTRRHSGGGAAPAGEQVGVVVQLWQHALEKPLSDALAMEGGMQRRVPI